jgi:5-methylcytosine-specific restriction protein A
VPLKPPTPCRHRGCPKLTHEPGGFCDLHLSEARRVYDRARGNSTQRGYGAGHRKRRLFVLRRDPLCIECLKRNRTTASSQADHIIPLSAGGPDTVENMQGLCKPCHSRKTLEENR